MLIYRNGVKLMKLTIRIQGSQPSHKSLFYIFHPKAWSKSAEKGLNFSCSLMNPKNSSSLATVKETLPDIAYRLFSFQNKKRMDSTEFL
jgi:hypothetical protein